MDSPRPDWQRLVFLIAVGLIALHVLDDSFIQPEPGTSAGDHLVSGLVPFALLVGAVIAYPRVGPPGAPRSLCSSAYSESWRASRAGTTR